MTTSTTGRRRGTAVEKLIHLHRASLFEEKKHVLHEPRLV